MSILNLSRFLLVFFFTHAATGSIAGDEANLDIARVVAGHKIAGKVDAYFKRHYEQVKTACERIRDEMRIGALHKSAQKKSRSTPAHRRPA